MTVRAKLLCAVKTANAFGDTILVFTGVTPDGSAENKVFSDYTPAIRLEMTISKGKSAADAFVQGGLYYADLTGVVLDAAGVTREPQVGVAFTAAEERAAARPERISGESDAEYEVRTRTGRYAGAAPGEPRNDDYDIAPGKPGD